MGNLTETKTFKLKINCNYNTHTNTHRFRLTMNIKKIVLQVTALLAAASVQAQNPIIKIIYAILSIIN